MSQDKQTSEQLKYLHLCCKAGQHTWIATTSPDFELCQYCRVVRKKALQEQERESNTENGKQRT